MQSHTRKAPRMEVLRGEHSKQKEEHAAELRKLLWVLSPVFIAALLIGTAYLFGVIAR